MTPLGSSTQKPNQPTKSGGGVSFLRKGTSVSGAKSASASNEVPKDGPSQRLNSASVETLQRPGLESKVAKVTGQNDPKNKETRSVVVVSDLNLVRAGAGGSTETTESVQSASAGFTYRRTASSSTIEKKVANDVESIKDGKAEVKDPETIENGPPGAGAAADEGKHEQRQQRVIPLDELRALAQTRCPTLGNLSPEDSIDVLKNKIRDALNSVPRDNVDAIMSSNSVYCLQLPVGTAGVMNANQALETAKRLLPGAPPCAINLVEGSFMGGTRGPAVHIQVKGLEQRDQLVRRAAREQRPLRLFACFAQDRCGCSMLRYPFVVACVTTGVRTVVSDEKTRKEAETWLQAEAPNVKVDKVTVSSKNPRSTKILFACNTAADDDALASLLARNNAKIAGNSFKPLFTDERHEKYFTCKCGSIGHGLKTPCPKRVLALRVSFARPVNAYEMQEISSLCPEIAFQLTSPGAAMTANAFPNSTEERTKLMYALTVVVPDAFVGMHPLFTEGLNSDYNGNCNFCNAPDHRERDCAKKMSLQGRKLQTQKRNFASVAAQPVANPNAHNVSASAQANDGASQPASAAKRVKSNPEPATTSGSSSDPAARNNAGTTSARARISNAKASPRRPSADGWTDVESRPRNRRQDSPRQSPRGQVATTAATSTMKSPRRPTPPQEIAAHELQNANRFEALMEVDSQIVINDVPSQEKDAMDATSSVETEPMDISSQLDDTGVSSQV